MKDIKNMALIMINTYSPKYACKQLRTFPDDFNGSVSGASVAGSISSSVKLPNELQQDKNGFLIEKFRFPNDTYAKPTTKKVATKKKRIVDFILNNFNLNQQSSEMMAAVEECSLLYHIFLNALVNMKLNINGMDICN